MSSEACAEDRGSPPLGLLLVNLGTPASPSTRDVRRFLGEFLSDRRVVEISPWLWQPILRGIVLPFRGPKSARLYRTVWSAEGSPLLARSRAQARALARRLGPAWRVVLAMRYGEPSIAAGLDELAAAGCERVVLAPAFPQYSATTTASVYDATFRALSRRRSVPALTVLPPHPSDAGYIAALAARTREACAGVEIARYVFSFHGLPERYVQRGDPYPEQCRETAEALAAELGLAPEDWIQAYQSRFGPGRWLGPAVEEVVPALAGAGPVAVATPGFVADCLETLEEIGERLVESFHAAGGERIVVVPALNDHPRWIEALALLLEACAGTETAPGGERGARTAAGRASAPGRPA